MAISEKLSVRDIVVALALIVIFVVAMIVVVKIYRSEGEKAKAEISDAGETDANHVAAYVKLLAIDPIKGDISARIEFTPDGDFADETGALARPVKVYVNSANGKQEHEFAKGKRMTPIDVTVSLYDGKVTDYPFDSHQAFLEIYLTTPPEKAKAPAAQPAPKPAEGEGETPAAAATPTPEGGVTPAEPKTTSAAAVHDADNDGTDEVPLLVDFFGSVPGYRIEAAKSKESDIDYVGIDMKVSRSSTVVFFSSFVMFLMWGATIAVLLLVLSIILRGRKIEVGMFSFLAALLFALVAVRNSQPAVPPIGTLSDFIAFFWAEVILALCLLSILFVWLIRPGAK
jgi:hypothetical protein